MAEMDPVKGPRRAEGSDLDRLREAITKVAQLCVGQEDEAVDVVIAAARRFLALTETGPDYEAAHAVLVERNIRGRGTIDSGLAHQIVDAALADYLTEEE